MGTEVHAKLGKYSWDE